MERLLRFLCVSLPRGALGTLIGVGVVINVANVAGRYLFNAPIVWAEEILVLIMVACVFLGAILVTWEGQHIRMDLVSTRFGKPWRQLVLALDTVVFLLVCGFVVRHSWSFVQILYETGQKTVVARLPAWLAHATILAGFAGMLLVVLARLRNYLSGDFGGNPASAPAIDAEPSAGGADGKPRSHDTEAT